jgi:hypothetical protein
MTAHSIPGIIMFMVVVTLLRPLPRRCLSMPFLPFPEPVA